MPNAKPHSMRNPTLVPILFTPDYSDLRPVSHENKSSHGIYSQNRRIQPTLSGNLSGFVRFTLFPADRDRLPASCLIACTGEWVVEFSPEFVTILNS